MKEMLFDKKGIQVWVEDCMVILEGRGHKEAYPESYHVRNVVVQRAEKLSRTEESY